MEKKLPRLRFDTKRDSVTGVTAFFSSLPVFSVEPVGGAKLVAHDAQELLTLLKNVEIDEGNLQVVVVEVALHTVEMTLAHYR